MKPFEPRTFTIPELKGISKQSVDEHIALYQGYVKNYNAMSAEMMKIDTTQFPLAISEMLRRISFEFGGMRLHEYYFAELEGGAASVTPGGAFEQRLNAQFGSVDKLKETLKHMGMLRGPGWAMLYFDKVSDQFLLGFSGEQHNGHFVTLPIILALDVWEHTYILDNGAAGKGKYIDAFFANLNWQNVEKNFLAAQADAQ